MKRSPGAGGGVTGVGAVISQDALRDDTDDTGIKPAEYIRVVSLFVGLAALTLVLVVVPGWRFAIPWPAGRQPVSAFGAATSLVTSALAYLWYSFTRSRRTLFVAVAFLVLGANQFVFGLVLPPSKPSAVQGAYFLIASRLVAGAFLLAGGLARAREDVRTRRPLATFLFIGSGAILVLGSLEYVLWLNRSGLPRICCGAAISSSSTAATGITPVAILACFVIVAIYLSAAYLLLHQPGSTIPPHGDWLSMALVLGVFVQIHSLLIAPPLRLQEIASSDLLRLSQYVVLLLGFLWEVRLLLWTERQRGDELHLMHTTRDEAQRLISHDLLHSIATLTNLAGHLTSKWRQAEPASREDAARRIYRQSFRLSALAEETLTTLSSATARKPLSMRPEAITDIVEAVVDSTGSLHGRLVVRADALSSEAVVLGNMVGLCRVLLNLVWNAEEHSPEGSPIVLNVDADPGIIRFAVTDVGEGLSVQEIDDLLEGTWPSSATTAATPAARGLGLRSSRAIVDAHGGRLTAHSATGVGSTFVVTIPRWRPSLG